MSKMNKELITETLLPCPFCGSPAHKDIEYVNCSNKKCPVRPAAKYYTDIKDAVKDWNTRAPAPSEIPVNDGCPVDHKLFEQICIDLETTYGKTDDNAKFHDIGALRGYIHSFLGHYIARLPKRESVAPVNGGPEGWAIYLPSSKAFSQIFDTEDEAKYNCPSMGIIINLRQQSDTPAKRYHAKYYEPCGDYRVYEVGDDRNVLQVCGTMKEAANIAHLLNSIEVQEGRNE